jgi:hypothetical protein
VKETKLIRLSAISGLISGVTWTIGDILLVGFTPNPADYPFIMQSALIRDKVLAVTMLEGSTQRLAAGALLAAFTAPFMFFALYHLFQMIKVAGRTYAVLSIAFLFIAFAWSPLAHASFFFVGEACKTANQMNSAQVFALAAKFIDILYITWFPAIILTGMGWLLVSIIILGGKTGFPRAFAFFTPLPVALVFMPIVRLLPAALYGPVSGAGFNLAAIVFYVLTTIFCFRNGPREIPSVH